MAKAKRKYFKIGSYSAAGVVSIVLFFLFLQTTYGFQITGTDDICKGIVNDPCISYINITNPTIYNVDVYNQDQVKLAFSPEIKEYYLFRKDGRCKGGESCAAPNGLSLKGWNYIDFTNETKPLKNRVYVYRFPRRSTKEFLLWGLKNNPTDSIKWTLFTDKGELDPVWFPEDEQLNESTESKYEPPVWKQIIETLNINDDLELQVPEITRCVINKTCQVEVRLVNKKDDIKFSPDDISPVFKKGFKDIQIKYKEGEVLTSDIKELDLLSNETKQFYINFTTNTKLGSYKYDVDIYYDDQWYKLDPIIVVSADLVFSSGTDRTDDDLILYYDVTDSDIEVISWKVNNKGIMALNLPLVYNLGDEVAEVAEYSDNVGDGNVTGAFWNATDQHGTADVLGQGTYEFNGTTDYLVFDDSPALDNFKNGFSVEVWVKPNKQTDGTIVRKHIPIGNSGFFLTIFNENFTFGVNARGDMASHWEVGAGYPITEWNRWYHVVGTYDNQVRKIYVDGVLADYENQVGKLVGNSNQFFIGQRGDNFEWFNGSIDEVRIWNRSLSEDQIKLLNDSDYTSFASNETRGGETWQACIVAVNDTDESAEFCSNNVTILQTDVNINSIGSDTQNNFVDENITGVFVPSGGATSGIINWYLDGNSTTILNMPFKGGLLAESNTKIKDYSGYGNNGTLFNATFNSTGGYDGNGSYEFNGNSSYILTPTLNLVSSFSISIWAKPYLKDYGDLISTVNTNRFTLLTYADGHISYAIGDGAWGNNTLAPASTLTTDKWSHIVATYDGTNISLYVDGVVTGSVSNKDIIMNEAFTIGKRSPTSYYYNGSIDEVLFFNESISPGKVRALYAVGLNTIISNETVLGDTWTACITPFYKNQDGLYGSEVGVEECSDATIFEMATVDNFTFTDDGKSGVIETKDFYGNDFNRYEIIYRETVIFDNETENWTTTAPTYNGHLRFGLDISPYANITDVFFNLTSSENFTNYSKYTYRYTESVTNVSFGGVNYTLTVNKSYDFSDLVTKNPNGFLTATSGKDPSGLNYFSLQLNNGSDFDPVIEDIFTSDPGGTHNLTTWVQQDEEIQTIRDAIYCGLFDINGSLDDCNYNLDGTVNGASFNKTGGLNGSGAYYFNALTQQNVTIDNSGGHFNFGRTTNFTVSFWINLTNPTQAGHRLIGTTQGISGWFFDMPSNKPRFFTNAGAVQNYVATSNTAITTSRRTHIVGVAERNKNLTWYIDGNVVATTYAQNLTGLGDNLDSTGDLVIGNHNGESTNGLNGTMDNIYIFNRSLSASKVLALKSKDSNYIPAYRERSDWTRNPVDLVVSIDFDNFNFTVNQSCNNETVIDRDGSEKSLLAWYTFDNTTVDLTKKYNGTGFNLEYSGLGINKSGYFNGNNTNLTTPTINLGGNFTISMWTKPYLKDYGDLLSGVLLNRLTLVTYADGRMSFAIGDGIWGNASTAPAGTLTSNQWSHIVTRYNSTHTSLYVNGDLISNAFNKEYSLNTAFTIGQRAPTSYYFNGSIDEVKFYNVSKTNEQIRELYRKSNSNKFRLKVRSSNDNVTWNPWQIYEEINLLTGFMSIDGNVSSGRYMDFNPDYNQTGDPEFTCKTSGVSFSYVDSCNCPSTPSDWLIDLNQSCILNDPCNITGYNISFINNGNFTINSSLNVSRIHGFSTNRIMYIKPNALVKMFTR